ncbi:MAG TPA: ABC transporter substrate-binding protein [Vicinamibacterales bacterium]|jgi:ABC-type nitrate/sulfonate/bicarbonate transport system substrate-binding protein|nr:ABC transporter substrate-binding protein [Vicinamibacterales bacterium]
MKVFPARVVVVFAAAVAAFGCAAQETAAPQQAPAELRKIVINYPNRSGSQWPLFLAKEGGFYAKNGLDVELSFGVHPAGVAMLASGQGQMVNSSLEQLMQAASKDGSMSLVGSSLNRGTFALMASKEIGSVEALKGKRVAISQVGDAPYGYIIAILSKAGLSDRDVEWIPVGQGVAGRAAALTSGRADATLLTAPAYFKLETEGYKTLVNLAERDDIFASTAYLMAKSDLQPDTKLAEALIKSHAEAIKQFYEDKPAAIAAYRKYDPDAMPEDVDRTYDLYAKPQAFERVPYVLTGAVNAVLSQQADPQLAAQMKAYDFKQVIDNSIVDKLVREGYFVQLFGDSIKAEQDRKASLAFGK